MDVRLLFMLSVTSVMAMGALTSGQALRNGNGRNFVVSSCSPKSGDALGYFILETFLPSIWMRDKFCQALADGAAKSGNYNISLQLFNDLGSGSDAINSGHPGIAFNAKDSMNYDFIYFRPHWTHECYQTGYIKESVLFLTGTSTCPNGPPKGQQWFTVLLEVTDHETKVFLDGDHVVTLSHHHENVARGGAIVANGYMNQVFFRGYNTTPHRNGSTDTKVAACVEHRESPEYNTLDATSGTWPASGFCRVLIGSGSTGTKYRLSVDLYNEQGWQGINSGHPGVMYNVQDIDNYDFVYFRPHFSTSCFQTGIVRNGQLNWDGAVSSRCSNGAPVGGRWFNVEVRVSGSSATIFKDGVLVHTARPRFRPRGNGGVIVANGYKNVIRYKDFRISVQ